jgi:hypothetical protein
MGLPPGLDPQAVGRPAEVVPALGRGPPAPLAGGLAGPPAGRLAAVPLVVAVTRVGIVQLAAVPALATSGSRHGQLQNEAPMVASAPPKPQSCVAGRKPSGRRRVRARREEDPAEENHIFTPAESPHFQNGDETGKRGCASRLAAIRVLLGVPRPRSSPGRTPTVGRSGKGPDSSPARAPATPLAPERMLRLLQAGCGRDAAIDLRRISV